MAQTPRVILRDGALAGAAVLPDEAIDVVCNAIYRAEELVSLALAELDSIVEQNANRSRRRAWAENEKVVKFFGDDEPSGSAMRKTWRRIRRCHRRLSERRITVVIKPQPKGSETNPAKNLGLAANWYMERRARSASRKNTRSAHANLRKITNGSVCGW